MVSLFFLHRLKLDDANFWDRIDSMVLFCGMFSTARTKMGMIQQTYNGKKSGSIFELMRNDLHIRQTKKNNILSILRRCKI